MHQITAACSCHMGLRRSNNEDNFYFAGKYLPEENGGLEEILTCAVSPTQPACFGVFDGMGGEAHGEEAAYLAALTMRERMEAGRKPALPETLLEICREANQRICQAARGHGGGIMGSTAVLLGFSPTGAHIVNVGDSRAFLWRRGALRQQSVDHTDHLLLSQQKVQRRRPRLTQHLGIEPEEMVIEPSVAEIAIQQGDIFLLCSDGLTDMVSEESISKVLQESASAAAAVERLIGKALDGGGRDNITVMVCAVS